MLRRTKALVAVAVVAGVLSSSVATAPAAVPLAAPAAPAASPAGEEIVALRTRESKTFRTETPGVLRQQIWAEPVHYQLNGAWAALDTKLAAGPLGFLRNAANSFGLQIARIPTAQEFLRFDHGGGLSVRWGAVGARLPLRVTTAGSSMTFANLWPNVDVDLQSTATGLKEDLVLKSAAAQREFVFPLSITGGSARLSEAGEVEILDTTGAVRAVVPHGYMTDSAGPGLVGAESFGVTYELVPHGQGQALRVRLDNAWLNDPARVWPVRVDPNYLFYSPGSNLDDTYTAQTPEGERSSLPVLAVGHTSADPAGRYRRAYLHFTGAPTGVDVTNVALYLKNPAALSGCGTANAQVHRVTSAWTGTAVRSFTNGAPATSSTVDASASTPCGSGQTTTFTGANLTATVAGWANGTVANNGLMIRASNETDAGGFNYREFRSANGGGSNLDRPYMEIFYNSAPDAPQQTAPSAGAQTTLTPTLSGTFQSNLDGDTGRLFFEVYDNITNALATSGWGPVFVGQNQTSSWTVPAGALTAGRVYKWRAVAMDDRGAFSPWTAYRTFTAVAVFPPQNPQATASDASVLVQWNPPSTGPAPDSYRVAAYTSGGTFVAEQTATTLLRVVNFSGLTNGTSYYFRIYSRLNGAESTPAQTPTVTPQGTLENLLSPTNVQAVRGDKQVTVTWTKPSLAVDGTTSYQAQAYRASDNVAVGTPATTTSTAATITGLKNGTPVYIRVTATNLILAGPPSAPSNTVTPAGPPFAPENLTVARGDKSILVSWDPPSPRPDGTPGNNGDPISRYEILTYRVVDGALVSTTETPATSATVTLLKNGTAYYVRVQAINGVGTGLSTYSGVVIPAGPPFAPVNVVATATDGQAHITWDPPPVRADGTPGNNGDPITSYTVRATPDGPTTTVGGGTTQADISLTNGTTYTFTVTATNGVGQGAASDPSNPVTPSGVPFAPESVVATLGENSLIVSWDPPSTRPDGTPGHNGSPITTYLITVHPDGDTYDVGGNVTSVEMAGAVEAGSTYSFTLQAVNEHGPSGPSPHSNTVTPECSEEGAAQGQVAAFAGIPPFDDGWSCDPSIQGACENGEDDDGDGFTDHEEDDGCVDDEDPTETFDACNNGVDDDGDGKVDWTQDETRDPGCGHLYDNDETDHACSNDLDDDGDGIEDYPADPGCATDDDDDETDPQCVNGLDDDSDGDTDWPDDDDCDNQQDDSEANPVPPPDTSDPRWVRYPTIGQGPGAGTRVMLSPAGHHPDRPGCVNSAAQLYTENTGARATATRTAELLQLAGYEVYVSNRDGTDEGNGVRGENLYNHDYAIELDVDLHVPIHSNAPGEADPFTGTGDRRCNPDHPDSSDPDHGGTLLVWSTEQQRQDSLAVLEAIEPHLGPSGLSGDGLFQRDVDELTVPSANGIRAIYFEVSFHTQLADVDWMSTVGEPATMVATGIRRLLDA